MLENKLLIKNLDTVLDICRLEGWDVVIEYTSPPKGDIRGQQRVMRCRKIAEGKLALTVANEVPGKEV